LDLKNNIAMLFTEEVRRLQQVSVFMCSYMLASPSLVVLYLYNVYLWGPCLLYMHVQVVGPIAILIYEG
jgi:hypothetical protein